MANIWPARRSPVPANRPRCNAFRAALLAGTALGLMSGSAQAADTAWIGAVDSDWFTALNWNNGVPTASDNATINSATAPMIGVAGAQASTITIGDTNVGWLAIEDGGTLATVSGIVGNFAGGESIAWVTGAGSQWTSSSIGVGVGGHGELGVTLGGRVSAGSGILGVQSGMIGTVIVNGSGSQWNGFDLVVGDEGQGTFTVANGGAVNLGGDLLIGRETTGSGYFGISGGTSTLSVAGMIEVGRLGVGQFHVGGGATATTGQARLGGPGGQGTVQVHGANSTWNISGNLYVGHEGTGTLTIANGGAVTNDLGRIGMWSGSGTVTVTGTNSTWTNGSELVVGYFGNGALVIENGGEVSNTEGYIGYTPDGSGTVTVTGAGSVWTNSDRLRVGEYGAGTLTVADGGAVTNTDGTIGHGATGPGSVTVTGVGSVWTNHSSLTVGGAGTGVLTIADGGFVWGRDTSIAAAAGVSGDIVITGLGSILWNEDEFTLGDLGVGTVTISDGGSIVSTGDLWIGSGTGSSGTLNIGAAAGDQAAGSGFMGANVIRFGDGAGTINFNHTDSNYQFSSWLHGHGTVNHLAGMTRLIGDSSNFSGITNVLGGTLRVDDAFGFGMLGGIVNVTGGTLGGTGTLTGTATIGAGGTIAPGNSIGTLVVAGDLTFSAGSVYEVEINDSDFVPGINNDLIIVGGTATINGGTVHVTPENGTDDGTTYAPGTYTILTAANIVGTFSGVTDDFLFLGFSLDYDANNVYLNSFQTSGFVDIAETPNQMAVAEAVDGMGGGAIFDAIVTLTSEDEALAAYDALSGEIHASAGTVLIEDSRFLREAVNARIRAAFGEAGTDEGLDFWAHGFGARGSWASDGNAARLDRSIGGLFIGGDAALTDEIRLGVVGGYSRSGLDIDDRASSGSANSYHLGVYGGGQWGDFSLRGGASHSWHSLDVSRSVAFTGFSDRLSASYNARTFQVFGEAGYGFAAAGARFEPYAGLAHVRLKADGFAETGGPAALLVEGRSAAVTFATIGIRAETDVAIGESEAKLRGGLAWRHAMGNVLPVSTHAFVSGSDQFTIAGVPVARNVLAVEAGFDMKLTPAATLGLSYGGQFGSGLQDHTARASFSVTF